MVYCMKTPPLFIFFQVSLATPLSFLLLPVFWHAVRREGERKGGDKHTYVYPVR